MAIPCSHQKSFSSMFVNLCLIRLPKRSVGVTEVNLITDLKSEKSNNTVCLHNHNELQARYQNLVSDIPRHLGTIFFAIIIKGKMLYSFSHKLISRCHNWGVQQCIFISFAIIIFFFLFEVLLFSFSEALLLLNGKAF